MNSMLVFRWYFLLLGAALFVIKFTTLPVKAQVKLYNPTTLSSQKEIADNLTEHDIPTGEGGFAKDYTVDLKAGEQVAIDLISEDFDAMVMLIASDGSTVGENDDGPDGTTNSLLFSRIEEDGKYIVRVRAFGDTSGGKFNLKLTRLRPDKNK